MVECVADDAELRRRLDRRAAAGISASDGRWELLERQREEWEPVAEAPRERYLRLDTSGTPDQTMDRLLLEIFARRVDRQEF